MTYKPIEYLPFGRPIELGLGSPFSLFRKATELRLGYEIVRLATDPITRTDLGVSRRKDFGIGIDSDLPPLFPQEVIKRLGDYHAWSAFHRYNWPPTGDQPPAFIDLIDRVRLMLTDEVYSHRGRPIKKADADVEKPENIVVHEMPSPVFDLLYLKALKSDSSGEKIKALQDQQWREHAKVASRWGVEELLRQLQSHRGVALEQLADISAGRPVIETAVPRFEAIERLLRQYVEEMRN